MSNQTDAIRGLVRSGASLLRSGAGLLERVAGGPEDEASRDQRRFSRADPQASTQPKDFDDITLVRKVESIIFRPPGSPRGSVDVNAVAGVVYLRGEVKHPEDVKRLVAEAEAIPEVVRVENLLHLPKTPAYTRTDPPVHQRKDLGKRHAPHTPEVHIIQTGITGERPVEGAEPSPVELAREHRGRQPPPMGSHDTPPPPAQPS